MTHTIHNLYAGPAILPREVIEEAARGVLEIGNSGLSILEVSHRGPEYEPIQAQAQQDLLDIMGLSDKDYTLLFLGGGASMQFAMVPMNFLTSDTKADYLNTGEWASRAVAAAGFYGNVDVVGSSEDENFCYIPRHYRLDRNAQYLHYTSNNTIYGTAWNTIPDSAEIPLVCDMSSDFLSGPLDYSRFSLIYAGAQKNAGPAGATILAIRRSFLERAHRNLPEIMSYAAHVKADAMLNTPPVFSVFVVGLVAKWIKKQGGLEPIGKENQAKAALLYDALELMGDFYKPTAKHAQDRSIMNVTFRLANDALTTRFVKEAEAVGFKGLKGHRRVGGIRASIYNAYPLEGIRALVEFLTEFAKKNG